MTSKNKNKKKAVVLLSGGIDSSTAMAKAKADGFETYALSFDYHQRHRRELESAALIAEHLGAAKHLVISFDLRDIGGSALTSGVEVPKRVMSYELGVRSKNLGQNPELHTPYPELIPITYVPARNTIFLSFGLGWAETLEAEDLFIGANAVDYSGYPDCRPEYIRAFEDMANLATRASVEGKLRFSIKTPLISLKKSDIIRMGSELGLDYSLTWSCYDPQPVNAGVQGYKEENPKLKTTNSQLSALYLPCGLCDSCLIRKKGFAEAGLKDPLVS